MHTLLFDIDGTLVDTAGAGRAALDVVMASEFSITQSYHVPVSGRTDRGIARTLFRFHGIAESVENWQRFRAAYLQQLELHLPRRPGRVLPGISELLEHLASHPRVALGLLTGNVRDGARLKLQHYGLFHYFPFGGYGDQHADRNQVAREAIVAVRDHLNGQHDTSQVWVIGDTPLDIRCARSIGARVLAVATGIHPAEELEAERPDLLLDDLADPSPFLNLLV